MKRAIFPLVLALCLVPLTLPAPVEAASNPEVLTILQGREAGADGGTVLILLGTNLTKISDVRLLQSGWYEMPVDFRLDPRSKNLQTVRLYSKVEPGNYLLELSDSRGITNTLPVALRADFEEVGGVGGVNDAGNPVDWADLKGVPAGFADGADNDSVQSAGAGLFLTSGQISVQFFGTGASNSVARADHDHLTSHYAKSELDLPGTLNSPANPMDWSRLKNVPAGFADGVDDSGTYSAGSGLSLTGGVFSILFGGTGSATTTARSDHEHASLYAGLSHAHDALYYPQSSLNTTGTLNASGNPVDWTRLKNVPSGFADGIDDGSSYSAGAGLSLTSGQFAVVFGGAGSASSASRSDHQHDSAYATLSHDHDTRYFTETELSTAGTLNSSGNPVDWSRLKNVPAAFADGTDDVGSYEAGTGLDLAGGIFSILFAGGGSASTAARSDHEHDSSYVLRSGDSLSLTGSSSFSISNSGSANTLVVTSGTSQCINAGITSVSGSNNSAVFGYGTGTNGGILGTNYNGTGGSVGYGVKGIATGGTGVYATSGSGGNALVADQTSTSTPSTTANNIAIFRTAGANKARIDNAGVGYFNGGTTASGADFAESVEVAGARADYEPGDVMVIDLQCPRRFTVSREPCSTLVAGVYATQPGVLVRPGDVANDMEWRRREVPMAIVGIVPVKVCDEGGPIAIGDLLVTSSRPGHAMKAPAAPAAGTVLGKALGTSEGREGRIEVLLGPAR